MLTRYQLRKQLLVNNTTNNNTTNIINNSNNNINNNMNTFKELEVNIDFDEAIREWKANKKPMGNSQYKYICQIITKSGTVCGNVCYKCEQNCWTHRNKK